METDIETLRGLLVFGLVLVSGLFAYWIWAFFKLVTMAREMAAKAIVQSRPRPYERDRLLLMAIEWAHRGMPWHYLWLGPIEPPGEIVLAWREWTEANGQRDRTLDVLFVKPNGEVNLLGTGIQEEIYGKSEEKKR